MSRAARRAVHDGNVTKTKGERMAELTYHEDDACTICGDEGAYQISDTKDRFCGVCLKIGLDLAGAVEGVKYVRI